MEYQIDVHDESAASPIARRLAYLCALWCMSLFALAGLVRLFGYSEATEISPLGWSLVVLGFVAPFAYFTHYLVFFQMGRTARMLTIPLLLLIDGLFAIFAVAMLTQ